MLKSVSPPGKALHVILQKIGINTTRKSEMKITKMTKFHWKGYENTQQKQCSRFKIPLTQVLKIVINESVEMISVLTN